MTKLRFTKVKYFTERPSGFIYNCKDLIGTYSQHAPRQWVAVVNKNFYEFTSFNKMNEGILQMLNN